MYNAKYPKVIQCLAKHKEEFMAFYDFLEAHWQSLRITNPNTSYKKEKLCWFCTIIQILIITIQAEFLVVMCTQSSCSFASVKRRKVQTEFSGGDITRDSGVMLLRSADKKLNLLSDVDKL